MTSSKPVILWLALVCFFVFSTVVVGGITRLTRSGLSMVVWEPIVGVVPPLTQGAWEEKFEAYKKFPEYQKINHQMKLAEFKIIFFWEYIHRVLGRTIGLVFFIPYLFFLVKKRFPPQLRWRFFFIFMLGGCQGLLGWIMVKSGLVDNPHVSHYRLTAHLGLALLIYALVFWSILDYNLNVKKMRTRIRKAGAGFYFLIVTSVQIGFGGLVAGLKAGFVYNTFPKMNGEWVPFSLWTYSPWVMNFLENPAGVQFIHRCLGWVLFLGIVIYWGLHFRKVGGHKRLSLNLMAAVVTLQFIYGISTLVHRVPVVTASIHQAGAVILLSVLLFHLHQFGRVESKLP